jgi:hypothetical protein
MAEEKNESQLDESQLSEAQLDEANGGRNWFTSEYIYEDTNYIHKDDGGEIQHRTEICPILSGGNEGHLYVCKTCGDMWYYTENTVKKYFTTAS